MVDDAIPEAPLDTQEEPEKKFEVVEVIATKISLKPGETLFITFKSDMLDFEDVANIRKQLKPLFPNNKVAILVVRPDDDIKFTNVDPTTEEKTNEPANG